MKVIVDKVTHFDRLESNRNRDLHVLGKAQIADAFMYLQVGVVEYEGIVVQSLNDLSQG